MTASEKSAFRFESHAIVVVALLLGPSVGPAPAETELERINRLHNSAIIISGHDHMIGRESIQQMKDGGVTAKAVDLTTDGLDWNRELDERYTVPLEERDLDDRQQRPFAGYPFYNWRERFERYLGEVEALAADKTLKVVIVKTADDIRRAKAQGMTGLIIASEGVRPLGSENEWEQNLTRDYQRGLREIQIGHAGEDNLFEHNGRLTKLGGALVCRLNDLGIVIDLEHQEMNFVKDVLAVSGEPVLYSHDFPLHATTTDGAPITSKGMDDDLIQAVAGSGGSRGVIGLHFYEEYYEGNPTGDRLANGARFLLTRTSAGRASRLEEADARHVAIGSDFFPERGKWVIPDLSRMRDITTALATTPMRDTFRFSDDQIKMILGGSLLQFYEYVWSKKGTGCNETAVSNLAAKAP